MTDATSGTIQEDVPSVEFEEKQEPIVLQSELDEPELNEDDPRAAIYKKHDEKRAEEFNIAPVTQEPVEAAPEANDDEVTVKVNGKERKVARSKVDEAGGVKAYQKTVAADEMLRQASEELRKAREYEVEMQSRLKVIEQQSQELQTRAQQSAPSALPAESGVLKEMARKYHEAILDGDMDSADDLLVRIQSARGSATTDEDTLVRKATAAARAEMIREQQEAKQKTFEKERSEAASQFSDLYPDIAEDPELFKITNAKTIEIHQAHPDWGPKAIIDTAAAQVREWINGRSGAAASSDKLEAKRSQTTIRSGSARATPRPAPKPLSNSQYVEELRKARGLGV